jgi:hypothetical protein
MDKIGRCRRAASALEVSCASYIPWKCNFVSSAAPAWRPALQAPQQNPWGNGRCHAIPAPTLAVLLGWNVKWRK